MAALATQADLEARIGPLNATQAARVDGLLDDASGYVRDDTGHQFELVAADTVVFRPIGAVITLPSRPVTAVTSVVAIARPPAADRTLETSAWAWDGIDKILLNVGELDHQLVGSWMGTNTYRVTYDHGPAAIPAVVKAVVCEMVNRVLTSPSLATGITQETIGKYGYQLQQSVGTQGTAVRYTDNDKRKLRRYRKTAGTIQTRSG